VAGVAGQVEDDVGATAYRMSIDMPQITPNKSVVDVQKIRFVPAAAF
jgi:hypothetical protein